MKSFKEFKPKASITEAFGETDPRVSKVFNELEYKLDQLVVRCLMIS